MYMNVCSIVNEIHIQIICILIHILAYHEALQSCHVHTLAKEKAFTLWLSDMVLHVSQAWLFIKSRTSWSISSSDSFMKSIEVVAHWSSCMSNYALVGHLEQHCFFLPCLSLLTLRIVLGRQKTGMKKPQMRGLASSVEV